MLHLFHPAVVHFPVALLVLGGLCEAGGLLAWIPTVVTGYLAANTVLLSGPARPVFDLHELNGWLIGVALVAWGAWLGGEMVYGHGVGVIAR